MSTVDWSLVEPQASRYAYRLILSADKLERAEILSSLSLDLSILTEGVDRGALLSQVLGYVLLALDAVLYSHPSRDQLLDQLRQEMRKVDELP